MFDESTLIRLAKKGDTKAFRELVEQHQQQVRATVFGMLGNCPEAEEVSQEVFIRFYKKINQFEGNAALSTYLTRIAINLSLNEIKRKQRRRKWLSSSRTEDLPQIADASTNPNRYDNQEAIYKMLNLLEPDFRSVIVLRLIDGFSLKETAEILNLPQGTIASRLSRAQKKLKDIAIKLNLA
jgi:RNA polymerase sigma-70 factor (ECF subfamily)